MLIHIRLYFEFESLSRSQACAQRVGFVTAAVFEAVIVHRWQNEFKKTKLYTNMSPAAGTNLVLAAGQLFLICH
jgi:hypothetical protein